MAAAQWAPLPAWPLAPARKAEIVAEAEAQMRRIMAAVTNPTHDYERMGGNRTSLCPLRSSWLVGPILRPVAHARLGTTHGESEPYSQTRGARFQAPRR